MKFYLFIAICFFNLSAIYSQSKEVIINGNVSDFNEVSIPNVQLFLLKNNDLIEIITSDNFGNFKFKNRFDLNNTYYITLDVKNKTIWVKLLDEEDTLISDEYQVNLKQVKNLECKFEQGTHYNLNAIEPIPSNYLVELKELLLKHPNICVEFQYYSHPLENKLVANERISNFKQILEFLNVNFSQIRISNKIIENASASESAKSAILAKIYSMDGDCDNY